MAQPCTSITDDRLADLLEEIFIRLPTPADLVRVSVLCSSFLQVVADRSFLRRFRKSHSPPFLGFIDRRGFHPALPPHTSAPTAGALAQAADFSFSFLPAPNSWTVQDSRDGRVLLSREKESPFRRSTIVIVHTLFTELAVCDPLHRQYRLLPPIPDVLATSAKDPLLVIGKHRYEVILVPLGKEEEEEEEEDKETSFGVIWMAQCRTKPVAFKYLSRTGQWQAIASQGWSHFLGGPAIELDYSLFRTCWYANGCLYWTMAVTGMHYPRQVMLVLDTIRMEFSVADYPRGCSWGGETAIVEAGEGRLGLLDLEQGEDGTSLHYIIRQKIGEGSSEWQMERSMPLDAGYHYAIGGATERYLLLQRSYNLEFSECFSLDVKTFHLEWVCKRYNFGRVPIYTNFPPSLSSRAV